jgi:hypothetical protein
MAVAVLVAVGPGGCAIPRLRPTARPLALPRALRAEADDREVGEASFVTEQLFHPVADRVELLRR